MNFTELHVRESDRQVFVANIAKAHALLGLAPKVTPKEGVAQTIEWMGSVK